MAGTAEANWVARLFELVNESSMDALYDGAPELQGQLRQLRKTIAAGKETTAARALLIYWNNGSPTAPEGSVA